MPIIPLKQTVTITRVEDRDEWGEPAGESQTFTLRCRIDEGTKLTRSTFLSGGQTAVSAGEVLEATSILLDKYADIRYSDSLTYVDGGGREITGQPIKVTMIRGINGKPVLTEVII